MSLVHGFKLFCLAIGFLFNPLEDRWYVFSHAYKAGCDNRRDQDEVERLWMPEQLVQKVLQSLQVKQVKQMKQVKQKVSRVRKRREGGVQISSLVPTVTQLLPYCLLYTVTSTGEPGRPIKLIRGGAHPMAEPFEYISHARLIYQDGYRNAYLGEVPDPVVYGVQGKLREYYGAKEGPPIASTLDHIVAAVAG